MGSAKIRRPVSRSVSGWFGNTGDPVRRPAHADRCFSAKADRSSSCTCTRSIGGETTSRSTPSRSKASSRAGVRLSDPQRVYCSDAGSRPARTA